jgi:hypothetical protein
MRQFLAKRAGCLVAVGVVALAAGVIAAYLLPDQWQTATALALEPQQITLDELAEKGPGGNPHVVVTHYVCGSGYVSETMVRKGAPRPGPTENAYGKAWIPLFPKSATGNLEEPEPKRFAILLETSPTVASTQEFHMLSRKQSMEGLVVPFSHRRLSSQIRDGLAANYPETDFGKCLVLVQYEPHEKEDPRFFANALAVIAGSGFLIGLVMLLLGLMLRRPSTRAD